MGLVVPKEGGGEPMKLIIQIPCFNEAEALPITLQATPASARL